MTTVARIWDNFTHPLRDLALHRPARDSGGLALLTRDMYAPVLSAASAHALEATLEHVEALRRLRRVRRNLAAVAFLERFEAVVADELTRRSDSVTCPACCAGAQPVEPARIA